MLLKQMSLIIFSIIIESIALLSLGYIDILTHISEQTFNIMAISAWVITIIYIGVVVFEKLLKKSNRKVLGGDIYKNKLIKYYHIYSTLFLVAMLISGLNVDTLQIFMIGILLMIPFNTFYFYILRIERTLIKMILFVYAIPTSIYTIYVILFVIISILFNVN